MESLKEQIIALLDQGKTEDEVAKILSNISIDLEFIEDSLKSVKEAVVAKLIEKGVSKETIEDWRVDKAIESESSYEIVDFIDNNISQIADNVVKYIDKSDKYTEAVKRYKQSAVEDVMIEILDEDAQEKLDADDIVIDIESAGGKFDKETIKKFVNQTKEKLK